MESCVVCSNSSLLNVDRTITFHPFPKVLKRKKVWLKILKLDNWAKSHRVCSNHFVPKDFRPGGRFLYPLVVPKLSLPVQTDTSDVNNTTQSSSSPSPQNISVQESTDQDLILEQVNSDNVNKTITFGDGTVIQSSPPSPQNISVQDSTDHGLILEQVDSNNVNKTITFGDGTLIQSSPPSHQVPAKKDFTQQDLILEPVNSDNVNKTITFQNDPVIHGSPASDFLSPRRSSRKIKPVTLGDNSTYLYNPKEDIDELDFNKKPKEIIANGMRCSAWNCPSKYPVPNLSFFSYPSDLEMRKLWIKNCGSEKLVSPDEHIKSTLKVCSLHFSDEMYLNKLSKKYRLVPKAVPTIFNNCDTSRSCPTDFVAESPDVNNVANTILHNSSTNNNSSMMTPTSSTNNNSSTTSSIMDLEIPQNLMSQEYPKPKLEVLCNQREPEDEVYVCDIPGCIYSKECLKERITKNTKHRPFAAFNPSIKNVDQWSTILGVNLTPMSRVCERHFRSVDIKSHDIFVPSTGVGKLKGLISAALPVAKLGPVKRPRVSNVNEHSLPKKTKKQSKDSPKPNSTFGDMPEGEKSVIDIVPPIPIENQTLHFNTEPMESQSNISYDSSTASDDEDNLSTILPKILKNNSLTISLQPATSKLSKPVSVPSQSTKNNIVLNNVESSLQHIIARKLINNSNLCVTVDLNINQNVQIPATQSTEEVQKIKWHDIVEPRPIDTIPIITIDDSTPDEQIPSLADLKKIFPNVPESKIMRDVYWLSRDVRLPNNLWKCFYYATGNSMVFIENDEYCDPIKRIYFRNSYVPTIFINKKVYVYKEAVKTKEDLENLLEDINDIGICSGFEGYSDEKCIGYFENTSDEIEVCRNCQMSETRLRNMKIFLNAKFSQVKELEERIEKQKIRVEKARILYDRESRRGHNQVFFL